jgi:anaerobic magnesium-protoporphyrin IX monomethyl ester cyclase
MKILFLIPRLEANTNPPLGVAYIAAYIRSKGYGDVEILDPTFEDMNYVFNRLEKTDYDVLGISSYTMNYNLSLKFAKYVKSKNKNCKIVFGGIHPTILYEDVIKENITDYVVIGEGEYTFYELLETIKNSGNLNTVDGLVFKQNGQIIKNKDRVLIQDLNSLPFPARDLLPMKNYLNANYGRTAWSVKQPATSIVTTRGCPFHCTYCSSHLMFGRKTRYRSIENILSEIDHLAEKYNIKGLSIVDDTFIINKDHIYKFVDELKKRKYKMEFICNGRVDTIDKGVLAALKSVGCEGIAFGVESGSQDVLDNILKKGIKLEQVKDAFKWSYEVGIPTDGYFMIGIPGETEEDIKETIRFSKQLKATASNFAINIPMPKTELYDIALRHGDITAKSWDEFNYTGKTIYKPKNISQNKLNEYRKKAIISFYFRPSYFIEQLLSIRCFDDILKKVKGFYMLSKTLLRS